MATEPLTLEQPETTGEPTPGSSGRTLRELHPIWLGAASGLGLWLAFPPAEWHGLAWVALVPLLLLVDVGRPRRAYLGAWAGGIVFWASATEWVRLTDPGAWPGWLAMALVLSLFWPGFLVLARLGTNRLRLPLLIAAPAVWVSLEYVREYFLTGFPWYYVAHTQFRRLPVIQIADVTGVWGVSFLIVLVNACVADLLRLPLLRPTPAGPRPTPGQLIRVGSALSAVVLTLGYGFLRLNTSEFQPGPTVALLQSNLVQRLKMGREAEEILSYYNSLIERALATGKKLDLVVWPETSYPYGYVAIEPGLDDAGLQAQIDDLAPGTTAVEWRSKRDVVDAQLHRWVDEIVRAPMMIGTIFYDFRIAGRSRYNSAVLIEPKTPGVKHYHKTHLVPFGEYVPLIQTFPWLTYLTPYRGSRTPSLTFGGEPRSIELGAHRFAVAICFEDTLPHVVRPMFAQAGRSPDVLLNQSNDGWFHDSTAEHVMHLACSVFRTVEHRVPLARAANTGISAVVNGDGRIVASLETGTADKLVDGALVETVPLDPREGLYTKVGDWLPIGCLACVIGWIPLAATRRRAG